MLVGWRWMTLTMSPISPFSPGIPGRPISPCTVEKKEFISCGGFRFDEWALFIFTGRRPTLAPVSPSIPLGPAGGYTPDKRNNDVTHYEASTTQQLWFLQDLKNNTYTAVKGAALKQEKRFCLKQKNGFLSITLSQQQGWSACQEFNLTDVTLKETEKQPKIVIISSILISSSVWLSQLRPHLRSMPEFGV